MSNDDDFDLDFDFDDDQSSNLDSAARGTKVRTFGDKARAVAGNGGKIFTSVFGGARNAVTKNINDGIKNNFRHVSRLSSEGTDLLHGLEKQRMDVAKEIRPVINKTKNLVRQAFPLVKPYMPNSLYNKLNSKVKALTEVEKRDTYTGPSKEDSENSIIAQSLEAIFNQREDIEDERRAVEKKEQATEKLLDRSLDAARHTDMITALQGISVSTGYVSNFYRKIYPAYLRKDLEVKYKQLFVQKDILSSVQLTAKMLEDKLEAIRQNVALPEVQKRTMFETAKDTFGKKTAGRISDSISNYSQKVLANVQNQVTSQVKDLLSTLRDGLDQAASAADMMGMMNEDDGMGGPRTSAAMNVAMDGSKQLVYRLLNSKLGKFITGKTQQYKPYIDAINRRTANLKQKALLKARDTAEARGDDGSILGKFFSIFNPGLRKNAGSMENKLATRPTDPAFFSVAFTSAVEEVIPGWLGKIHKEIASLRAGNEQEELVFDAKSHDFIGVSQLRKEVLESAFDNSARRGANIGAGIGALRGAAEHHGQFKNHAFDKLNDQMVKFLANHTVGRPESLHPEEIRDIARGAAITTKYQKQVFSGVKDPQGVAKLVTASLYHRGVLDTAALDTVDNWILTNQQDDFYLEKLPSMVNAFGLHRHFKDLLKADNYDRFNFDQDAVTAARYGGVDQKAFSSSVRNQMGMTKSELDEGVIARANVKLTDQEQKLLSYTKEQYSKLPASIKKKVDSVVAKVRRAMSDPMATEGISKNRSYADTAIANSATQIGGISPQLDGRMQLINSTVPFGALSNSSGSPAYDSSIPVSVFVTNDVLNVRLAEDIAKAIIEAKLMTASTPDTMTTTSSGTKPSTKGDRYKPGAFSNRRNDDKSIITAITHFENEFTRYAANQSTTMATMASNLGDMAKNIVNMTLGMVNPEAINNVVVKGKTFVGSSFDRLLNVGKTIGGGIMSSARYTRDTALKGGSLAIDAVNKALIPLLTQFGIPLAETAGSTALGAAELSAKTVGKAAVGTLSLLGKLGKAIVTSGYAKGKDKVLKEFKYVDIYRKDKMVLGEPLLSKTKQQKGVLKQNGEPLKTSYDIDQPIIDPEDKSTLISTEDIEAGLCTTEGVLLEKAKASLDAIKNAKTSTLSGLGSLIGKAFTGAGKGIGYALGTGVPGMIGAYSHIFDVGKDILGGAGRSIMGGLNGLFGLGMGGAGGGGDGNGGGSYRFGWQLKRHVGRKLDKIYQLLMLRFGVQEDMSGSDDDDAPTGATVGRQPATADGALTTAMGRTRQTISEYSSKTRDKVKGKWTVVKASVGSLGARFRDLLWGKPKTTDAEKVEGDSDGNGFVENSWQDQDADKATALKAIGMPRWMQGVLKKLKGKDDKEGEDKTGGGLFGKLFGALQNSKIGKMLSGLAGMLLSPGKALLNVGKFLGKGIFSILGKGLTRLFPNLMGSVMKLFGGKVAGAAVSTVASGIGSAVAGAGGATAAGAAGATGGVAAAGAAATRKEGFLVRTLTKLTDKLPKSFSKFLKLDTVISILKKVGPAAMGKLVAKLAGPVGIAIAVGMALKAAYTGYNNSAAILGVDETELTVVDKFTVGAAAWIYDLCMLDIFTSISVGDLARLFGAGKSGGTTKKEEAATREEEEVRTGVKNADGTPRPRTQAETTVANMTGIAHATKVSTTALNNPLGVSAIAKYGENAPPILNDTGWYNKLQKVKYEAYGIDIKKSYGFFSTSSYVMDMEKLLKNVVDTGNKLSSDDIEKIAYIWNFDKDKDHIQYIAVWLQQRVIPVYKIYLQCIGESGYSVHDFFDMPLAKGSHLLQQFAIKVRPIVDTNKLLLPSEQSFGMYMKELRNVKSNPSSISEGSAQIALDGKRKGMISGDNKYKVGAAEIEANGRAFQVNNPRIGDMARSTLTGLNGLSPVAMARGASGNAPSPSGLATNVAMPSLDDLSKIPTADIPDGGKSDIGSYVKQFESGNTGSSTIGWDGTGGTSYGTYQFAAKVGGLQDFLKWCSKKGGVFGKKLAEAMGQAGPLDTGGKSGAAVDVWKQFAAVDGGNTLAKLEHAHMLDRVNSALKSRLLKDDQRSLIQSNRGLQEAWWSTVVQHGPGGAAKIFSSTFKENPEEWLRAIYATRGTKFGSSTPNIQAAARNRFKRELPIVLGLAKVSGTGGTLAGTSAPGSGGATISGAAADASGGIDTSAASSSGYTGAGTTPTAPSLATSSSGGMSASSTGAPTASSSGGMSGVGSIAASAAGTALDVSAMNVQAGVDLEGLNPLMQGRLSAMSKEFEAKTGRKLTATSGKRSVAKQAQLYNQYGPGKAAKPNPLAPHISGVAVDINSTDANEADQAGLLKKYGLWRPLVNGLGKTKPEAWHVELEGSRDPRTKTITQATLAALNGAASIGGTGGTKLASDPPPEMEGDGMTSPTTPSVGAEGSSSGSSVAAAYSDSTASATRQATASYSAASGSNAATTSDATTMMSSTDTLLSNILGKMDAILQAITTGNSNPVYGEIRDAIKASSGSLAGGGPATYSSGKPSVAAANQQGEGVKATNATRYNANSGGAILADVSKRSTVNPFDQVRA